MKGVGELLEGLLPYSQRHYTRVDRLQRSTYLLDYTLTGMSVIEPDTEPRDENSKHPVAKGDKNVKETAPEEGEDYPEPNDASTKKRKTRKSEDKKQKKSKVAYVSSVAISSQA